MNPTDPLSADAVDELLSAELDGAFDAAARDLGYAPAIARELLDATPGIDARRAAFAAAREDLAVPPLDADRRAAIVATAVARRDESGATVVGRRTRAPRMARTLAAAAAVVIVVGIGVAIVVRTSGHDQRQDTSESAQRSGGEASATSARPQSAVPDASGPSTPPDDDTPASDSADAMSGAEQFSGEARLRAVDFGDLADAAALRGRVEREIATTGENSERAAPRLPFEASLEPCVEQQAERLDVAPGLVIYGPARYRGQPAEILVYQRGDDDVAVIVAEPRNACTMIESLVLHSER